MHLHFALCMYFPYKIFLAENASDTIHIIAFSTPLCWKHLRFIV